MKCTSCGKEIDEDSKFCEYCGHPIKDQDDHSNFCKCLSNVVHKHKLIAIVCAVIIAIFLLFFFVIDNPHAHHSEISFSGWIFYEGQDTILIGFNPSYLADETPYHYNNCWQQIYFSYIDGNGKGGSALRYGEFRPRWKSDIGKSVAEDWCFAFSKEGKVGEGVTDLEFQPGGSYCAEIHGLHRGILFDRPSRLIRISFVYPQEVTATDFQVKCDIDNSPNIQPERGSGSLLFILFIFVAFAIPLTLFLRLRHKRKIHQ